MPIFTTIDLENLLEPLVGDSYKKPWNFSYQVTPAPEENREKEPKSEVTERSAASRHIYISPALYTTPEPAPIPDIASENLSESPYVVNHKRRGGGVGAVGSWRITGFDVQDEEMGKGKEEGGDLNEVEEVADGNFVDGRFFEERSNGEDEGFLDSRCELMSVGSANETTTQFDSRSYMSTQGDFFDAIEDFSSDNSVSNAPSFGPNAESELRAMRLSLLEEISKRKSAEEALNLMRNQWQRISDVLAKVGFICTTPSNVGGIIQDENTSMEELVQEVIVSRFVAESIGKDEARAKAELAAQVIFEAKDQEISRLRDRVKYHEAVNCEMSRRNQEIIDVARKQRERKKMLRRRFWSCLGLSVTVGVSVLAYTYLPHWSKHEQLPTISDSSNDSGISSSKAS